MYLRMWNALATLLSHVLAFAVNAYVIYVAFSYIRENQMWDLQVGGCWILLLAGTTRRLRVSVSSNILSGRAAG